MTVLLDRLDNQTKCCPNFIHSKTILYVKGLQQYSCNLLFEIPLAKFKFKPISKMHLSSVKIEDKQTQ